ncbi:MAG: DNA polymerase domain-containing protein [Candidatus Bathyarchaeia archaeon]
MERANKVIGAVKRILDYSIELSKLVGIPLDYVGSAAVGFKVEWLLMREATRLGELAPERVERPYFPYAGGIVLEPKEGIHENIAVLDFKSLYPNIMVKYNISPDTYVEPDQKISNDAVYEAPEVKHRFLKEPPGLYKKVLMDLMSARDELRAKLRVLDVESASYRLYDARQKAVKVITNAVYGYAGWLGARWYVKPVAEASSAWGRSIISRTVELSSKIGLKIIYGDTDSIFVEFDEKKIDELSRVVKDEFGLELRPDKVYVRVLFTEAKKRYCGLLKDGRMDFVGFEVVRGDWAEVSKKVQESVLTAILKEKSPNKAREFVIEYISNLKERRVPLKDLVIWKSITKPIEEYKVNAPHIEAAKLLTSKGWAVYPGDKIGYVVTSGSGPIYKRAVPHNLASIDDIDVEYYISNQIVPPVERILKIFGVKI